MNVSLRTTKGAEFIVSSFSIHDYLSGMTVAMRNVIATVCLTFAVLLGSVGLSSSFASPKFYSVKNGNFFTDEGEVPLGCLSELMIELNGDDVVAAVYLNRTTLRGCIDSNRHSVNENKNYSLSIKKVKPNDVFWIRICESVDGSMGQTCDKPIIQFVKRRYLTPGGNKDVVSIEKLGEW